MSHFHRNLLKYKTHNHEKKIFTLLVFAGVFGFAQSTYVPDDNFEQERINLGYDSGPVDDYVPTANISGINSLDVSFKNIADLTGIEDFSALVFLGADGNLVTTIDISHNTLIVELSANDNSLLSSIITTNLANLQLFYANRCQISSVDFSTNTLLMDLAANENKLTSLNESNNPVLGAIFVRNNLLSIKVNNISNSNTYWTDIDPWTSFSLNYGACTSTLGDIEILEKNISSYPNPAKDKIYFPNVKNISKVEIYDMSGKLIKSKSKISNYLDVSSLQNGIYNIKIFAEKEIYKSRLIKD